jgi:hypothetical protein
MMGDPYLGYLRGIHLGLKRGCHIRGSPINTNFGQYWLSIPFISWAISMQLSGYYFFMAFRCAKFR